MAYRALEDITVEEIGAAGVPPDEAERLHAGLRRILLESGSSGPEAWDAISKRLLSPDLPFPLHQMMYYGCYVGFDSEPPPAWIPHGLVANALDTLSLPKGSAIAIDMQMTVTAVIIYLAIILAGYVVVSIADSFAPNEIATRLKIANAKAIFTQVKISCL
ncbi:hypothetical protein GW17_00024003 [Ensete ventricosum]|nr:hypothetical protein GW17_00024003 [Ensete ventricosum]